MSYDVTINGEWFNYTSNMHQFFQDFGVYPPDWQGQHHTKVATSIRMALEVIRSQDPVELAVKYDAPNGWGSVESAIDWLERIAAASDKAWNPPPELVEVSW